MATKILRSVRKLVNVTKAASPRRTNPQTVIQPTRSILFTANGQTRVLEVRNV